ncbi:MAG: NADPH-dependent glutamate synthase [Candidatus Omnitrophica bacterium]|nr:NADPH-dependent glutamate synthase [Candidatus Omnitrophota bacterium]
MVDRKKIPRQAMPERPAEERVKDYKEVPRGYTKELAVQEALRCLQCKNPKCVQGCPVGIDIPGFIKRIEEGKFIEAALKIKETNILPAVCGRVCPQEDQCEKECILALKGEAVAIGRLERFVADYERAQGMVALPSLPPSTGKKVGVIGAGPAGLTAAADLIKMGHSVTIFEALHEPGGVLTYGIPEFRLPKAIVEAEVDYLKKLGVTIKTDYVIGYVKTVDELLDSGYDAIFIGSGAGLPSFMGIPGENLVGVYSANEYLTRSNLMKSFRFPEYETPPIRSNNAVVVGGGNVAMDAARSALRNGAKTTVVYRRSRTEMPARIEEIHHAEEEGIDFRLLTNPVRIIGNESGRVTHIECVRMELGEPDSSGRRRPLAINGSEFSIACDTVIVAIGNRPNPIIARTTPGLETTKWGTIKVNEETLETTKKGVFAGGDIVTGAATVILAMGQARIAARSIDAYLHQ